MSERIASSDSSFPSPTLHAAGALQALPSPSSLEDDANSTPSVSEGTSSPSDSWRSSSALSSLLPPPTLTDSILDDLAVPQFSLAIVAQKHGLTLSGMLTWLNLPETREVLALRESAAYAHARHVAALNIGHAVETVASIVRDYNTSRPEREAQDRKTPGSAHRTATNARKAAWLLLQFARIVPVNEADLHRARGHVTRVHRTANVSERISPDTDSHATGCLSASANNISHEPALASASSLPSQPVHPAGALSDLAPASSLKDDADSSAGVLLDLPPASALKADADSPLASSLKDDANSSRVACLLEGQACSESANSPHGCASAAMPPDCAELSAHSRASVPSCAVLASTSPPVVHRGDPRGPPR